MAGIALAAFFLAALRAGSSAWFHGAYTLTFGMLLAAVLAARYRGAFWFGFAVFGWGYFLVGHGAWSARPPMSDGELGLNSKLLMSEYLENLCFTLVREPDVPFGHPNYERRYADYADRVKQTLGIGFCLLTLVVAILGGIASAIFAARGTRGRSDGSHSPRDAAQGRG
jgi:hypothetical protein